MFFELVSILFAIIPDYGNEYVTKEHKNQTGFKIWHQKYLNLNHNTANWSASSRLGFWTCSLHLSYPVAINFL